MGAIGAAMVAREAVEEVVETTFRGFEVSDE